MKTAFRDRHEQLRYAKFVEASRRLRQNPVMIDDARAFVLAHMQTDPHQRTYADRWLAVLALPAETIIDKLLADSPEGDLLATVGSRRPVRSLNDRSAARAVKRTSRAALIHASVE